MNIGAIVPRRTFLGVLGLIGLVFLWGCHSEKPTLRVGMDLSYPPFETIDENGKPAGVSMELATALAKYLHRELEIENMPFVGLIPSLQNGRLDCVISSLTDTEERRGAIDFSEPYLSTGLGLLVGKDSPVKVAADLDQPGLTVVVRRGTTGEVWARKNLQHAQILAVEKENSAVLEVVQKRADAFLYDQMSIWKNWQNHQGETRAILVPLQKEFWAVGLRKGNVELRNQVNAFLKQYRADGGFERLGDQFLKEQKDAFQKARIPFYF